MRASLESEEDLIQRIYASAYDPNLWVGVMERLSESVGGLRGCLTRIDMSTGAGVEAILYRSDPAWVDAYAQHFGALNIFKSAEVNPGVQLALTQTIQTDEDCLDRDAYHASEYYNDFMRPQDVDRALFIRLGNEGSVASTINIGRRTGDAFESDDLDLAARLQPHMVRAYAIGRRLVGPLGVVRSLSEALHNSAHPLFLVDAACTLIFANRAAEKILRGRLGLTVLNGRLTPHDGDAARRFERLVGLAANRDAARTGGSMSVPRSDGGPALALRTAPLPLDEGAVFRATAPVLVSVTDLESPVDAPDSELRDLFGLTAAEVRLAAAIFEGLTLAEAAEKFGLSVNTVRFQLARIFDKTGVSRQAELVKLMMRLASAPAPR